MSHYRIFIFFIFFIIPSYCFAQNCNQGEGYQDCLIDSTTLNNSFLLAKKATDQIKKVISLIEQQVDNIRINSSLKSLGKKLITVISVLVIIWSLLKGMVLSSNLFQIISDLTFPFIFIGLSVSFLDNDLGQILVDSVQFVSNTFTNSNDSSSSSTKTFAENMTKSMVVIWDTPNDLNILDLGVDAAIIFLMKLISIFLIAGALASGLSILLIVKFQISLAIALAPIMMPWAIWKPTEFLFNGWLNFLLKSSFVSLTVSTIEYSLRDSISQLAELAGSVPPGVSSAYVYGVVSMLSLLFSILILKSSEIGSGIISGNSLNISVIKNSINSKIIPSYLNK
jgi:hypothetical protein